ncbi:hypothetical protein HYU50_05490 [Candidatus Woesearchaeota archaeon]|nr:hypothetical protein [Candidatus Woesearchaeota archaeon]
MYKNPFTPGYEVLSKSGYSFEHNSLSSAASYLITNDFPDYAAMFYSPSEHEFVTSIKYGNFEAGYHNLNDIRESLNGPPMDFYVPSSFVASDGSGRNDERTIVPEKVTKAFAGRATKEALEEIKNAQMEVSRKKMLGQSPAPTALVRKIEFEDVLLLRKIRRTIFFEEQEEDI